MSGHAMSAKTVENDDLRWDLQSINDKSQAISFVKQFEKSFCVFSGLVGQLYSNYTINIPESTNHNLVILPDPYAFHDTFFNLNSDAVFRTGMHILSGDVINRKGLYFISQNKEKKSGLKLVPFQRGMEKILEQTSANDPFLPVLLKGDLRQLKPRMPCLHLHRLQLSKLKDISSFDRLELKRVITNRLIQLYRDC